jgi:hypothetical protein
MTIRLQLGHPIEGESCRFVAIAGMCLYRELVKRLGVGLAALVLAGSGVTAVAVPAGASPAHVAAHACTRTASHKCIKGGEFCPRASYKKSGWDAKGRHYVCKGSKTHPHWQKP